MLSLATVFVTSFGLALSGAMMPGPLLTTTISESVRRGAATGPILILGHALLELAMVGALLVGLAPFLTRNGVFAAIALVGAGVLVWMAIGMFRALPTLRIDWNAHQGRSGPLVPAGILVSASNPYWAIWWATIGLGYLVSCKALGPGGVAAFFLGHIAGDLAWYTLISVLVAKGRRLLTDRIYRGLIGACATFLAGFAFLFAYAGIGRLVG
jgi:threonine/homoserine/homoserine lactone efflux protein